MKRLLLLIMASLLLFTACKNDNAPADKITPEQYITEIYSLLSEEEIPLNKVYNSYFSKASKDFILFEKYTAMESEKLDGIRITSVKNLSSKLIADDRYKVTGTMNYIENDVEKEREFSEYLVLENGNLKYLYDGIFSRDTYIMPEDASTLPLHMNYVSVYAGEEYMLVKLGVENAGSTAYSIGKESLHGAVTVETDCGSFTGNIDSVTRIRREETTEIFCKIPGVKGKPAVVSLSHIFSVDFRNEIIDTGDGFSYGVQLVDFEKEETTNEENQ